MLARWDPFREMMSLRDQMDRRFNDWFSASPGWGDGETAGWQTLPLDVSESDQAYTVCASIPGIKPEELEITLQNNLLTIRGEMKSEQEREGEQWHLRERRFGQFQRTISLPSNVDPNQVGAEYENGVLTLTLPKSEEVRPRRISVQQGSQQVMGRQTGTQQTIDGQAQSSG
jgi:HSP20 family protein